MKLLKTLIIEDDPNIRKLYEKSLKEDVFDKKFAPDGKAGLDAYKEWKPDLILLDMNMPIMSGFQVLKLIREEIGDKNTCIIVQTSKNSKEDIVGCAKFGIQGYIVKPFSPSKIADTILNYYSHCDPGKVKKIRNKIEQSQHGAKSVEKDDPNKINLSDKKDTLEDDIELYIKNNDISENQRKFLEGLRKELGIAEERCLEIEDHLTKIKKNYTINEFEYMGILNFCAETDSSKEGVEKILNWQHEKSELIKKTHLNLMEKSANSNP